MGLTDEQANEINKLSKGLENKPSEKESNGLIELGKILKEESDPKLNPHHLEEIALPGEGRLISEFAEDLVGEIGWRNNIFFKQNEQKVVRIVNIEDDKTQNKFLGFNDVTPSYLISYMENCVVPGVWKVNKSNGQTDITFKKKSLSQSNSSIVLESLQFTHKLSKINTVFSSPIPLIYNNKLTLPKKGYDERFRSYLQQDSPNINKTLSLEEAKKNILEIYSEFCFKEEQDKINAIAGLITPFLRGLYNNNVRTPIFFYEANRERAGKDCCAGITGMVFEGEANEETPLSTEDNKKTSQGEEFKKKILGAFRQGRKRLHFSNNKGHINNANLEALSTAKNWSCRLLGKNEDLRFENDLELSMSANLPVTYTPDLANRMRKIRLFLAEEDPNKRVFRHEDLHGYVKENRELILSSIYAIIRDWYDKGMPKGITKFSSFPEWANICGGIMINAEFGDPCIQDKEVMHIGGDTKTQDFKEFVEYCYEKRSDEWIIKNQLIFLAKGSQEECEIFKYYDFETKSSQIKFGQEIQLMFGRIFSDIKIIADVSNLRKSRHRVKFTKNGLSRDTSIKEFGNGGNQGNVSPSVEISEQNNIDIERSKGSLPTLPTLPKDKILQFIKEKELISMIDLLKHFRKEYPNPKSQLELYGIIKKLKHDGDIYEPKKDLLKVL